MGVGSTAHFPFQSYHESEHGRDSQLLEQCQEGLMVKRIFHGIFYSFPVCLGKSLCPGSGCKHNGYGKLIRYHSGNSQPDNPFKTVPIVEVLDSGGLTGMMSKNILIPREGEINNHVRHKR